jgi:hypothetical protein
MLWMAVFSTVKPAAFSRQDIYVSSLLFMTNKRPGREF